MASSILSRRWYAERKRDVYHKLAKKHGYRSRSAFKLIQLNERFRFIKKGSVVVDLGAAPGGWMQVAHDIVGRTGFVLGVDLQVIDPFNAANVASLIADVQDQNTVEKIMTLLPRRPDVVLSDLSPNVSGVWDLDHARQISLAKTALDIASTILKPRGVFLVKVFQGDMLREFKRQLRKRFRNVKATKPSASRVKSSELYFVGLGLLKNLVE
jgi:23S rRNA (uridine2552-2'-O)-methyltransferase